ncbi:MAG: TIGR03088 family PEP-CTERM/XrtA system glycosyltransferase [Pseudomonadota bacterium]|nr:TIGR03088 family PEP-CTERM/XrtA system glycosyltransferase [Pseudomonadota bacterium]
MKDPAPPLVLHVIHHLLTGGMENGLVNLINNMPASKYRHAIVCIEDYSDFRNRITKPDVEVIALHRSRIGVWKLRRDLFRLCRQLRPTILHSRNQSGLDALLPARLAGVPYRIHGEHGWDVDNLDGKKWKPALLKRLHYPLVDRYITVSRHLEEFLIDHVGIRPSSISHIYNGVDVGRFQAVTPRPVDWLPPEFRDEKTILIGTVGRLQQVKDQATLLRAFSRVVTNRPELRQWLRLVIVGGGPLLADLRALAGTLKISELTYFPGSLDIIPEVLRSLDIFVLPSLNEGISNTILEAMASGVPVLATAAGGNMELVEDNVNGRLFSPGDSDALSRLLLDYVLDPSLRKAHGQAARAIAVERFSLDAMVSSYAAVYDRLSQGRGTEK